MLQSGPSLCYCIPKTEKSIAEEKGRCWLKWKKSRWDNDNHYSSGLGICTSNYVLLLFFCLGLVLWFLGIIIIIFFYHSKKKIQRRKRSCRDQTWWWVPILLSICIYLQIEVPNNLQRIYQNRERAKKTVETFHFLLLYSHNLPYKPQNFK